MIVVDTDVLIDAMHGQEPGASRIAEGLRMRSLATTAITVFELLSGARSKRQRSSVGALLAAIPVMAFDQAAAASAATIRLELEQKGESIGMADYLIAGLCVSRSASLLTRNRKRFIRVPLLELVDL
jgi:tRNA(fMet)-specific endonuclease VapC